MCGDGMFYTGLSVTWTELLTRRLAGAEFSTGSNPVRFEAQWVGVKACHWASVLLHSNK